VNDPSYDRLKAYLREHAELKAPFRSAQFDEPHAIDKHIEPYSDNFERHVRILHTPAGDLESSSLVSLKGQPGLDDTFYLKDRHDIEKYLSLPMPQIDADVSSFFAVDAEMADRGIVDVELGMNPGGFVVELFGTETFALMSVTDRDLLHALCDRQMRIIVNRVEFLLSKGVGPFFSMLGEEYIVPPLHGPADFWDFNVRYDKPIIDLVHEANGRVHIHSHGSIKKVIDGFVAMGADVLHPFEAPPLGDVTAAEARQKTDGKLCLEGNIQISRMYDHTPEQIRREVAALIDACFVESKGLIVSPTASPYIPGQGERCFPQYEAMIDTVLAWRQ
jgi:hypothetical protein